MTDIVDRLRRCSRLDDDWPPHTAMVAAAADEIERLRAELAQMRDQLEHLGCERDEARAERDALQELYYDLLMSVGNRLGIIPRHETAKRYILNAERVSEKAGQDAALGWEGKDD